MMKVRPAKALVGTARPGFTLIELLVVIGVIAVLVAIGIGVGVSVIDTGRAQATRATITIAETIQVDLEADTDLRPRDFEFFTVNNAATGGMDVNLPLVDGRLESEQPLASVSATPSMARFLAVARQAVPGLESRWDQLDASLVTAADIGLAAAGLRITGTQLLDQWGNPLRLVHPSWDGGHGDFFTAGGSRTDRDTLRIDLGPTVGELEYRRSFRPFDPTATVAEPRNGDADEGLCVSGRPYVYSAGPDGDPGTREDNVYGDAQPQFPQETDGI